MKMPAPEEAKCVPAIVPAEGDALRRRPWKTPQVLQSEFENTLMPGPGGAGEATTPYSVS